MPMAPISRVRTVTASTTMSAPNQGDAVQYTDPVCGVLPQPDFFSKTSSGTSNNCDTARKSAPTTLNDPTDKYFGEYLARVKVCDSNEGPTRTDLCQKYGSNYKPEGTLQQKSDKIRVGALGYLTERDTSNA